MRTQSPRRAANAIEFALTLPLFLALVLAVCEYGYYFMIAAGLDQAVTLACREGAKTDPQHGDPAAVAKAALDAMSASFCDNGTSCTPSVKLLDTGPYVAPNKTLECTTVRGIAPLTGFVPFPASLKAVSMYRLEWQTN